MRDLTEGLNRCLGHAGDEVNEAGGADLTTTKAASQEVWESVSAIW